MDKIKSLPQGIIYFLNSCFVTVLDVSCVWVLYKLLHVNVVVSNTAGVLLGFIVGYFLTARLVFKTAGGAVGFIIYFGTFLVGLVLADWLIYVGEATLFVQLPEMLCFLCSKGLSVVVPYFVMYFLRKFLYGMLEKHQAAVTR